MKKIVCVALALLMLVGTLVACTPDDPTADTTTGSVTTDEGETRIPLEVPKVNYDYELTFLVRDGDDTWGTTEIYCGEITGQSDNFSQAVFERNERIERDYGVTILEYRANAMDHSSKIRQETMAPTGDFQAVVSDTTILTSMGTSGCLVDLNSDEAEYFDFTKPWWDTKMAESMSIDGHLYFATGDLLIDDNEATFALMFNKDLASDHQLQDMYKLVDGGDWTMDQFYSMEQIVKKDMDGDGRIGYGADVAGFAYTTDTAVCLMAGCGITLVSKDDLDLPTYGLDIDRAQEVTDLGKRLLASDCSLNLVTASTGGLPYWEAGDVAFSNNKALFYAQCMNTVSNLRNYEVNFGILPFPKFNKAQSSYYSLMHSGSSASFAIPRGVSEDDISMLSAIIEAMAYHSVDTLTEQYYEINLKLKSAQDERSAPMIDLILANRLYDMSYYYGWGDNAYYMMAQGLASSGSSVSSMNQRFKSKITNNINSLIKDIEKFEN